MKVLLCEKGRCCPSVEIDGDVVRIGEEGNSVELTRGQWDVLVRKVRAGEL